MELFGFLSSPAAWLAPTAAVAAMGIAAAVLLLRDHLRLERHTATVEAKLERVSNERDRLAEINERNQAILDAQQDLVVWREDGGPVLFANESFARFAQRRRSDFVGTRLRLRPVTSHPARRLPDGTLLIEEAFERPDGPRWIAWIESPLVHRGTAGTLRVGRDVTDQVHARTAAEDANSKSEALGRARLLARAGQDLRTPLGSLLGIADLALDATLPSQQSSSLRAIKSAGEVLLARLDAILNDAQIDREPIDLAERPFDLRQLTEGVVEGLAPLAHSRGLEIAAFVSARMPPEVVGDQDRVRQVLVEITTQAIQSTASGGIGITVERMPAGDLQFRVCATAPDGLSFVTRPDAGEPDFALARRIVARMNGMIETTGAPGGEAALEVRLPLAPAGAGAAPSRRLPGRHILIVAAASALAGRFIARHLEEAGAAVTLIGMDQDALSPQAMRGYDCLIADGALGCDAVRQVARQACEAGIARKLVLLSPLERRALGSPTEAGFDGSLAKPIGIQALFECVTSGSGAMALALAPSPGEPDAAAADDPPRVLLAEDNEINALLAMQALERLGAVVDWARDGQAALDLAEASLSGGRPDYDLILMDIQMPGLDGHEATRRIRELEHRLRRAAPTRIVALTARAMRNDREAAQAAGFDGFLPKPYRTDALQQLLAEARLPVAKAC